jgi:hypothetical protein
MWHADILAPYWSDLCNDKFEHWDELQLILIKPDTNKEMIDTFFRELPTLYEL